MNRTINIRDLNQALLAEISRLGGEERTRSADGALKSLRAALLALVRENPNAYGAGDDVESQHRAVSELIGSLRTSFLARTVSDLRRKAGYILVFGYWVHRAVFTFVVFGVLAAIALPLCAVSLLSTQAGGWLPGAIGLIVSIAVGVWILTRIRNR